MRSFIALLVVILAAGQLSAQEQQSKKKKKEKDQSVQLPLVPHEPARIFTGDVPLQFTLTTNFGRLRRDKTQNAPWREATISIIDSTEGPVEIPLKVRTRGIWRLNNCDFPPIRLDFAKSTVKHTEFTKLDKPKLVTHCKDNEEYEQYVLQEFQLYRVYNLLTNYSHRVRLARVTYADSGTGKILTTRYAFIEEDASALAHRVGQMLVRQQGAVAADLEPMSETIFAVFQYMIGNTDWSVAGLHNVELLTSDSLHIPIAYDFDFAGAVNTRYAVTDYRLPIKRVRDRLFRGYCMTTDVSEVVFDLFRAKKDSIYALYSDPIGKLLKGDRAKETLEYFDEFYHTISDPRDSKREIKSRCIDRG